MITFASYTVLISTIILKNNRLTAPLMIGLTIKNQTWCWIQEKSAGRKFEPKACYRTGRRKQKTDDLARGSSSDEKLTWGNHFQT